MTESNMWHTVALDSVQAQSAYYTVNNSPKENHGYRETEATVTSTLNQQGNTLTVHLDTAQRKNTVQASTTLWPKLIPATSQFVYCLSPTPSLLLCPANVYHHHFDIRQTSSLAGYSVGLDGFWPHCNAITVENVLQTTLRRVCSASLGINHEVLLATTLQTHKTQ